MHAKIYIPTVLALLLAAGSAPAAAQSIARVPVTVTDSTQIPAVLSTTLAAVREEFPFGRVIIDRVVVDTTKRLAPPLMSGREHKLPELWAKGVQVELVQTDMTRPVCRAGNVDCVLPEGVAGTIAFSDPTIVGDTAHVIVRHSKNTGVSMGHVTTVVETITLRKNDGDWKVIGRKIRASA